MKVVTWAHNLRMALRELPRIAEDQMMNWTWKNEMREEVMVSSRDDARGDNQYEVGDIEIIRISLLRTESESGLSLE